jgi:hypothetical protein
MWRIHQDRRLIGRRQAARIGIPDSPKAPLRRSACWRRDPSALRRRGSFNAEPIL